MKFIICLMMKQFHNESRGKRRNAEVIFVANFHDFGTKAFLRRRRCRFFS